MAVEPVGVVQGRDLVFPAGDESHHRPERVRCIRAIVLLHLDDGPLIGGEVQQSRLHQRFQDFRNAGGIVEMFHETSSKMQTAGAWSLPPLGSPPFRLRVDIRAAVHLGGQCEDCAVVGPFVQLAVDAVQRKRVALGVEAGAVSASAQVEPAGTVTWRWRPILTTVTRIPLLRLWDW